MARRGYDTYHGRNRFGTFLKVLIVILLLLLVAALAALFLLEPYIYYSADGVQVRLPFFQEESEPSPQSTAPLVVESTQPTPSPTPIPAEDFRGLLLGQSALYDGTAEQQLSQAGADVPIFNMKEDNGSLGYISQLELADEAGVSISDNPAINSAIRLFCEENPQATARISCFRDDTIPRWTSGMSIPSSAGNWRDTQGYRWLSPASAEARAYVIGVCQELAELGFHRLLLDNCGFPVEGKLYAIVEGERYDPENLTASLELFFQELEQALADYPQMEIWVVAYPQVLSGQAHDSGQTSALLEQWADRVLVAPEEGSLPASSLEVIPILTQPDSSASSWAVLETGS